MEGHAREDAAGVVHGDGEDQPEDDPDERHGDGTIDERGDQPDDEL